MSSIEIRLGASDAFAPPLKLALPAGGGLLRSPEKQNELFFSARRRPMAIRTYFWNVSLAVQVANSSSTLSMALWYPAGAPETCRRERAPVAPTVRGRAAPFS